MDESTSQPEQRIPDALATRLGEAEQWSAIGNGTSLASALETTGSVLEMLEREGSSNDPSHALLRAQALRIRGNCQRQPGPLHNLDAALVSYDEALQVLFALRSERGVEVGNELANIWTHRGIALLTEGSPNHLKEAVRSFDGAIECRRGLPSGTDYWIPYGLAAGWMNRGDALTRLGGPGNLELALAAYDEGLAVLCGLPLDANPAFRQRSAIAWMNRGVTLQAFETAGATNEAVDCFDRAMGILASSPNVEEHAEVMAAACMNHANSLIQSDDANAHLASKSARRAITYSDGVERESLASAEVGVKARYILCQALALLLEAEQDNRTRDELFAQATDAVDDGMDLIRHWNRSGSEKLQAMASDLFRFGSRVYQAYQPHFLTEFLLENLDPQVTPEAVEASPQMHLTAVEAIWEELRRISRDGFKMVSKPEFHSLLERLRLLRIADEKLTCLRNQQSNVNPPAGRQVGSHATAESNSLGEVLPDPRSDR